MADFLSDTWFEALSARVEGTPVPADVSLVIEQVVSGEPGQVWHFILAGGTATITRAAHETPDVRLIADRAAAEGIHRGEISAQRAFLDGHLQIGGDIEALMSNRETIAAIATLLTTT